MKKRKTKVDKMISTECQHKVTSLLNDNEVMEYELKTCNDYVREDREKKIILKLIDNPALFYNYAKKFSSTKVDIGLLLMMLLNYEGDMTELINSCYQGHGELLY